MRIAIFGVGSVGGYFGWRLTQAGEEVVFIARGENLRILSERGLTVETPDGKTLVQPVTAASDPVQVGPVDTVILAVKAWQVAEAAKALRPLIGPETFVVPLQNGVDAPSILAEVLGEKHAFGGLCYIAAAKVGPGRIRHVGMEPQVLFGELDDQLSERSRRLLQAFEQAGVSAEIPADIKVAMWKKFLFIASLSGVGAFARASCGRDPRNTGNPPGTGGGGTRNIHCCASQGHQTETGRGGSHHGHNRWLTASRYRVDAKGYHGRATLRTLRTEWGNSATGPRSGPRCSP